jgi:LPXTG-motif cell wall-anchored protein
MNSGGEVAYYGKLKDSSSNASGDLNIPLAGVTNGTYTLQIFSEEANGDNYTDFCSEPVSMTLEVTDGVGTVSGFRGTVLDTIAPVLSEGSALRTASAAADVSFTSDEAGTYYWQVDGTAPASADALVNGGASSETLVSGENAKELTGLAEGPHTVYIAAKDASDNVSNLLTISIPAPEQPAPVIYSVKEHFGTYTGSGALTVRIDADYSKFVRLKCDGIVVDPANYTVAQGSTIITLQDRYLKTLGNGTHWFVAEYTDGYSQGIRLDVNVPNVPQTGDNSSMQGWLAVMLGSALGILCLAVWRKRKKIKGTW